MLSIDSDLGRHLTLGNYILESRTIPTHDIFSHTLTGESRPPYEWLSQVIFALCNDLLGLDGVILLVAFLIGITSLLVFRHTVYRSDSPLISLFITLTAIAATSIHWLPRPHLGTFILLLIWIDRLERLRKGAKISILTFPLIMLLWANLHGGFIFGFLVLGAYLAGSMWDLWQKRTDKKIILVLLQISVLSLLASFITPDFWRNWQAVLNNRSAFVLSRTVETMPPEYTDPSVAPFLLLLTLTIFFFLKSWRDHSTSHIFLLGGLGFISFLMARNIPLFAIACAPILSEWISTSLNHNPKWQKIDKRFSNLVSASQFAPISVLTVVITTFYYGYNHLQNKQLYQFNPQVFPVEAVDWLEKNPIEGNMFNEFNWGGYMLYRSWPSALVFTDSQSDFYGENLLRDYEKIILAKENWQNLLDEYQIEWAIIPVQSTFAQNLTRDQNWEAVYQDAVAIIIQRK